MPASPTMPSAARPQSPLFRLLAAVLLAFLAAGCGGTDPAPGKTLHISSSMRASCPEHPFKPEFQGVSALRAGGQAAGKSAAEAATRAEYLYQVEIYDDDGDLVVEWSGSFDSQDPRANPRIQWAGTDDRGRPVPSGYYYMRIRIEDDSGGAETGTTCSFYVNPEDSGKLK